MKLKLELTSDSEIIENEIVDFVNGLGNHCTHLHTNRKGESLISESGEKKTKRTIAVKIVNLNSK